MGFTSSQYVAIGKNEEPAFTSIIADGKKSNGKFTVDYIFNTQTVTPLGYLSIPEIEKDSDVTFPNFQYPSNHISIMTYFKFA